ncbi:MAG: hypothetical protein ACKVP2_06090 [Burkholderiales bacterium]
MNTSKRISVRLTLALLLLFAQHLALAHQTMHAFDRDSRQSHSSQDEDSIPSLCAFHGVFDGLLGALDGVAPDIHVAGCASESCISENPAYFPFNSVIPASRGPPLSSL